MTKEEQNKITCEVMQDLKSLIFITAGEQSVACGSKNEKNSCLIKEEQFLTDNGIEIDGKYFLKA